MSCMDVEGIVKFSTSPQTSEFMYQHWFHVDSITSDYINIESTLIILRVAGFIFCFYIL